jgi:hypothetical protein
MLGDGWAIAAGPELGREQPHPANLEKYVCRNPQKPLSLKSILSLY